MKFLVETRIHAAIELLEHKAQRAQAKAKKEGKDYFYLTDADVNEILVVAGADLIGHEKDLEVIEV